MQMKLYLGVDGGQTTTDAVLADEKGTILAHSVAGPSDHTEEPGGPERLERVARQIIADALRIANISSPPDPVFAAACFGMSGETEIKHRILAGFVRSEHLSVVHDSVNALAGATAGKPGVIVIAGTGCVARGVDLQGRTVRVGGWGHLFGDEGSAYWIGREAVRAVAAQSDGFRPPTELTPVFFTRLGVSSASDLMAKYYAGEWSRDHLASLSLWVNEAAAAGDSVARCILRESGRQLAALARAVLSLLAPSAVSGATTAQDSDKLLVSYTGGAFKSEFVLASFRESLLGSVPHAIIRPPVFPPVLGSLILAYRSAGMDPPDALLQRWAKSTGDSIETCRQ